MIRIGINGFGRIGRTVTRVIQEHPNFEVVAINDIAPLPTMTHLLKYDSVHGKFPGHVRMENDNLFIDEVPIAFTHFENPADIPWHKAHVDLVIESTSFFKTRALAQKHLKPGVKKVIVSAPPKDDSLKCIVLGVNDELLAPDDQIVSNASCTTNCAAPMIKLINQAYGIESAYVTTIHSFTTDQQLHDAPHTDLRRARAATLSMVPTTTGAAKALSTVFKHLDGHIGGCGIRVPVPDGSLTDITFHVKTDTSVDEVNQLFKAQAEGELRGILGYTEEPLVSADIVGNPNSCLFDAQLTSVLGRMVKIVGWYDNEIGYSNRLIDLAQKLLQHN